MGHKRSCNPFLFKTIWSYQLCYVSTSDVRLSGFLYWPSDRKVNSAKPKFAVSPQKITSVVRIGKDATASFS